MKEEKRNKLHSRNKYLAISQLIREKKFDLCLSIELEKEKLFPDKNDFFIFGQFALLYEVAVHDDSLITSISAKDLREYFIKFIEIDKGRECDRFELLKLSHHFIDRFRTSFDNTTKYRYIINKYNKLHILDDKIAEFEENPKPLKPAKKIPYVKTYLPLNRDLEYLDIKKRVNNFIKTNRIRAKTCQKNHVTLVSLDQLIQLFLRDNNEDLRKAIKTDKYHQIMCDTFDKFLTKDQETDKYRLNSKSEYLSKDAPSYDLPSDFVEI